MLMEERLMIGGLAFQSLQYVLSLIIECEVPMSSSMVVLAPLREIFNFMGILALLGKVFKW